MTPNRRFPVQVALAALVVYGLTLNWGVTLNSLPLAAKVAGWDWQPMPGRPLLWLLTLPLHALPASAIPLGLNLLSAFGGAVTLGLLVRSIQLLPWDRPWDANRVWTARLPLLLACIVCGWEFNFWQEATAATGELVDLLLLAAALWCLLEYRVSRTLRWLDAAALVWGLGMAENWLMLLALPLFVAALLALRRLHFFNAVFLRRMTLLGLAGFSIYALLPLVNGLAPHSPWSFGQSWLMTLRMTKNTLMALHGRFWMVNHLVTVLVGIYYLLPTVSCLVRMPDEGTQNKSRVDQFQIWIYRTLRVMLLLACLWLALDPGIGPRQLLLRQFGVVLPLLSFDYLDALGTAFLAGNLLLILQNPHPRAGPRGVPGFVSERLRRIGTPALILLVVLVAGALAFRNAPAILLANRQPLESFGKLAVRSLPPGGGVVLSDDPQQLAVFQAALAHQPDYRRWLAVDTKSLPLPEYRATLDRKRPGGWLTAESAHELKSGEVAQLIERESHSNPIFYLHPSFGIFFEQFYLAPIGAVYEMKPFAPGRFDVPPLSATALYENEKVWSDAWRDSMEPASRASAPSPPKSKAVAKWFHWFSLGMVAPYQSRLLCDWYSIALDSWGVTLQRNGRLPEAARRFDQALVLNTNNVAAQVNRHCNASLQSGGKMNLTGVPVVAEQLGNLVELRAFMTKCGPFDHPSLCYLVGLVYQQARMPRQAVQQFERARALAPDVPAPELALTRLYASLRMEDKVLEIVNHLRQTTKAVPAGMGLDVQLSLLEANAWQAKTNAANARGALESILQQHPDDAGTWNLVLSAYTAFGDLTNALELVKRQLAKEPHSLSALNNEAIVLMQMGDSSNAIPILDRALALTNSPLARFNRATAYLHIHNYPAAEADYLSLENSPLDPYYWHYGLADLAQHRHDTNLARQYLQLCLTSAPPDSAQAQAVRSLINSLGKN